MVKLARGYTFSGWTWREALYSTNLMAENAGFDFCLTLRLLATTLNSRFPQIERASGDRIIHDTDATRLGRDRRISAADARPGYLFPAAIEPEHGRIFCVGAAGGVVARGHFDGGDDVCGGHSAGGDGARLFAGNRGQLAVVEFSAVWNDDG